MKYFSYVKKLTNERHAHYMHEFVEIMPRGLYDAKRSAVKTLVDAEVENLGLCRKNHNREKWNEKVNHLRAVMSALYCILCKLEEYGDIAAIREKHSYDTTVKGLKNNHDYTEAAKGFLHSWGGVDSEGAEALVEEAEEIVSAVDVLVQMMEAEDLMIACIPVQQSLREPTDDYVEAIVKRAEVEYFELDPDTEEERERHELVERFLSGYQNWVKRVRVSVKNTYQGIPVDEEGEVQDGTGSDSDSGADSGTDQNTQTDETQQDETNQTGEGEQEGEAAE